MQKLRHSHTFHFLGGLGHLVFINPLQSLLFLLLSPPLCQCPGLDVLEVHLGVGGRMRAASAGGDADTPVRFPNLLGSVDVASISGYRRDRAHAKGAIKHGPLNCCRFPLIYLIVPSSPASGSDIPGQASCRPAHRWPASPVPCGWPAS